MTEPPPTQAGDALTVLSAPDSRFWRDMAHEALTVVTAADRVYWRCLYQMLLSAERLQLSRRYRFVAYDLGLAQRRATLEKRFPWCEIRPFDFARQPPHIAPLRRCGWKPVVMAHAMEADGGVLLWLDSATIFKAPLDAVAREIRRAGVYSLKGQARLCERCERSILDALRVPAETRQLPERVATVFGVDTTNPAGRELVQLWRDRALEERYLGVRSAQHLSEQALLGVTLFEMQAAGKLELGNDEIDISSPWPVRWMSSRNKVPAWLPLWADPFARCYYFAYKTVDQFLLRQKHRRAQPCSG